MDGKKMAIVAGCGCVAAAALLVVVGAAGFIVYRSSGRTDGRAPGRSGGPAAERESGGPAAAQSVVSANRLTGLFYMQKYWIATRHLEKAVWYFAPDGMAYFNPEAGLSPTDLASVKSASKGRYQVGGGKLSVTWGDGKKSEAPLEIVPGGFNWDTGLFMPVEPFGNPREIVGSYEGGTSVSFSGNSSIVVKSLELRADGTFSAGGIASFRTGDRTTGGQGGTKGTWALSGYALVLTSSDGKVIRGITFPLDDEKTPLRPDRMFFSGISYNKQK